MFTFPQTEKVERKWLGSFFNYYKREQNRNFYNENIITGII
jgi:hypothetical protein